jgi:hypothetical protein
VRPGIAAAPVLCLLACGGPSPGSRTGTDDARTSRPGELSGTTTVPADSLVASTPAGAQIWFTLARPDSGPGGRCVARAVEIRDSAGRRPVPLLYTTVAPEIIDDTSARAWLDDHCRRGDRYRISLRSGRPVRERP